MRYSDSETAKRLARSFLNRRSVSLDPALRLKEDKAEPHFYPFVAYPYQLGSPSTDGRGIYTVSATDAEGPDGILVNNGAIVDIPVRLDRDMDFHLLWVKYAARHIEPEAPTVGSRELLAPPANSLQGGRTPFVASWNQRIPWSEGLDVTVYLLDAGSRDYYGGLQGNSLTRDKEEFRMPAHAIQSMSDGVGQIRLEAQLSASGLVLIRVENVGGANLRVNGHLFGYKVAA